MGHPPIGFSLPSFFIHLFKGYSVTNVFLLNAIAGTLALFSFYLFLRQYFSQILANIGQGLLAAYPIFALWTTSGGFEIVNLWLALLAFYLLSRLLDNGTPQHASQLVFTLILLAQVRYESVVFLIAIAPVAIAYCVMHPQARPSIATAIAPLLLLPVAWQRTLYSDDQAFMVSQEQTMFGLNHFFANIGHAFDFFSGTHSAYGTIPFLLYIALAGIMWGVVHLIQSYKCTPFQTRGIIIAGFASLALLSMMIFGYVLGNLTRPFSIRLGIIFLPFLITGVLYLFHIGISKIPKLIFPILIVPILFFISNLPITSRNESVEQLTLFQINRAYLTFLQDHNPEKNTLVISHHARLFIPHRQSAVTFKYADQNWPRILDDVQKEGVSKVLAFQLIDANTYQLAPETRFNVNPKLKLLGEIPIGSNILRASQVVTD